MEYILPLKKLIGEFRSLPGIGTKMAIRLAYHVLEMDALKAKELAHAIVEAKDKIGYCNICYNLTDENPCKICASNDRDHDIICVVEKPQDIVAIERMREYNGVYHVLHGALSPLDGIGPNNLRIRELLLRLEHEKINEVIMATNPNVEGEATAMYLANIVKPTGIKVSRIAHGLPAGTDLAYADEVTLSKAIENRVPLS